jgi:hypothetical protein
MILSKDWSCCNFEGRFIQEWRARIDNELGWVRLGIYVPSFLMDPLMHYIEIKQKENFAQN